MSIKVRNIPEPDTFFARWTRTLNLRCRRYRFAVTVDDGIGVYANNQVIINRWREQAPTTYTAEME